jgi:uncharacterized alkaline shock family protein YloU
VEGRASISAKILGRYASDAAREVDGVLAISGRRGVRLTEGEGGVEVELHLRLEWDTAIPDVGRAVQERVREYLVQMANVDPAAVEIVVDQIGAAA